MFAAVTLDNFLKHVTEGMFYEGMYFSLIGKELITWPYFVLLTLGIKVTELYFFGENRHENLGALIATGSPILWQCVVPSSFILLYIYLPSRVLEQRWRIAQNYFLSDSELT